MSNYKSMRNYAFSASEAERVQRCPASAALPRVAEESPWARRGAMIHGYIQAVVEHGREAALEALSDEDRAICEGLDLEGLGLDSSRWASEVAFAWDAEADTARELGRGIGRAYGDLGPSEIPGTADLVGLDESRVVVWDIKTGHGDVTPAAENGQLAILALMAARAYERDEAVVAIVRLTESGTWTDEARLGAIDLDATARRMREVVQAVRAAREDVERGRVPDVSLGSWCRFCPALRTCPGQTALVRAMLDEQAFAAPFTASLTLEQVAVVYERLTAARKLLDKVEAAVHDIARQTPVPLPDGRVLGEVQSTRESLVGSVVHRVMHDLYGAEAAAEAVEYSATKKRLDQVLRRVAEERGVPLAELRREALAAIGDAGGLTVQTLTSIRPHRPSEQ